MSKSTHNPAKTAFRSRLYLAYALISNGFEPAERVFCSDPRLIRTQRRWSILDLFDPQVRPLHKLFYTRRTHVQCRQISYVAPQENRVYQRRHRAQLCDLRRDPSALRRWT